MTIAADSLGDVWMAPSRESLASLHTLFQGAANLHSPVSCVLVDRPVEEEVTRAPDDVLRSVGKDGQIVPDRPTRPWNLVLRPIEQHFERQAQQCIVEAYGSRVREVLLRAPRMEALTRFRRLAESASRMLPPLPRPPFAAIHGDSLRAIGGHRWLFALFDLAWNASGGSPLGAERRVWTPWCTLSYNDIEKLRKEPQGDRVALAIQTISSPPDWFYSELDDVLAASCFALDLAIGSPDEQTPTPRPACSHSEDFTSVVWFGKDYTFAKGQQTAVVELLWGHWDQRTPGLKQETIGEHIRSSNEKFQLRDVFRRTSGGKTTVHPAWGEMIGTLGKGTFGLIRPQ